MSRKRRPRQPASHLPWDALYPTLDLHGHTADEARMRAERWLAEQREAGARVVRLITGRGKHSVGPPVLRGEIGALLDSLRGKAVAGYEVEPGGGALRVELRRLRPGRAPAPRPAPPKQARRGSLPESAELRRRAEEALWDLGVQPTPELVEAEMRRILSRDAGSG
jgi:hypothetical protein